MEERFSVLRAGRTLVVRNIVFRLLVLISVRSLVRLEGLGKYKKFNDLIENRIRDFPA
jgi:hypothetical protein